MSVIKFKNVTFSYDTKIILDKVSFDINENEKIGIVGPNGAGKSTLIKLLLSVLQPTNGEIKNNEKNIGYLKQATEYSAEEFSDIIKDKDIANNFLKINSEMNIKKEINFTEQRLSKLSGGEKTKIALSSILADNPNMLILDEPTNHVDIDSVEWLIEKLNNYKNTILVVSHDRYFLNKTVDKILEVDKGKVKLYHGNYDFYKEEKQKEFESMISRYENEQKIEKKLAEEIRNLNDWSLKGERDAGRQGGMRSDSKIKGRKTNAQRKAAKLSKSAENKKSRLEQLREEHINKPEEEKEIKFSFNSSDLGANALFRIENLSKSYDSTIFDNVNLTIGKGEKIGLIGPNGSGKSTFIKILLDQETYDGNVWKTPSLNMAYMSQDVFDLKEDKTIIELTKYYNNEQRQFFFSNLVNMGLKRDQFNSKISNLSLGERMRIKLVEIIIHNYNLLILDEPTNHLDLPNKIKLESALKDYPGSIIIASHDKELLSTVTNKIFLFKNGTITRIEDSYKEYLEKTNTTPNEDLSLNHRLRIIEEQMSDEKITPEEMESLLEEYYELLEMKSSSNRR